MASFWFHKCFKQLMSRDATDAIDLDTDASIKISLWQETMTPLKTWDFMSDCVTATYEIVATNYTGGYGGSGRKALAGKSVAEDNTNYRAVFDATDTTWTALGGAANDTIGWAVVFKEITSEALSPLILQLDISPDVTTNGGDFTIQYADGTTLGLGYVGV